VAIGNEAVYGRAGYEEDGLLGMDYVRLGLERGRTAYQALHIITTLLEAYGQGGNADLFQPRTYHNSFIIADPHEAWVLETAGCYWVAERVKERRAISNCYTIQTAWDEASPKLIEHAVSQGWWKGHGDFNFARAYGDPSHDSWSGQCRFRRATELLLDEDTVEVTDLMALLRDHENDIPITAESAADQHRARPLCMHETPPSVGATAASLVVHLRPHVAPLRTAVAWHSFGSPCLSAFHPLYIGAGSIDSRLGIGEGQFDPASPFWLNERIQRRADAYPALKPLVQRECQRIERAALESARCAEEEISQLADDEACTRIRRMQDQLTAAYLATLHSLDELTARLAAELPSPAPADQAHWSALNTAVGLELLPQDPDVGMVL
jgi:dipeptidase